MIILGIKNNSIFYQKKIIKSIIIYQKVKFILLTLILKQNKKKFKRIPNSYKIDYSKLKLGNPFYLF